MQEKPTIHQMTKVFDNQLYKAIACLDKILAVRSPESSVSSLSLSANNCSRISVTEKVFCPLEFTQKNACHLKMKGSAHFHRAPFHAISTGYILGHSLQNMVCVICLRGGCSRWSEELDSSLEDGCRPA